MNIKAEQFVTKKGRRVLTDEGLQGMGADLGVGSSTEKQQGQVAASMVRLYKN